MIFQSNLAVGERFAAVAVRRAQGPWFVVPRLAGLLLATAVIVASALGGSHPAQAATTCVSPDHLAPGTIDRAFTQQRFISGLSKALLSEGRVQVTDDRITWHMTAPFDVETVITPDGITQSINGKPATDVAPGGSGFAGAIVQSLADLLRGRWDSLATAFDIQHPPNTTGEAWSVVLRPLDAQLQVLFGSITVTGCMDVAQVEIAHPNGDREVIQFGPNDATAAP